MIDQWTKTVMVRPPVMADGPRMREILIQGFQEHGWVPPDSLRTHPEHARAAVAELDGRVVGVGLLAPADSYKEMVHTASWLKAGPIVDAYGNDVVLMGLSVDPAYRRRGVGRAIALARIEMAEMSGSKRVFVHCVDKLGAVALYQKLGFEPVFKIARRYTDGSTLVVLSATLPLKPCR